MAKFLDLKFFQATDSVSSFPYFSKFTYSRNFMVVYCLGTKMVVSFAEIFLSMNYKLANFCLFHFIPYGMSSLRRIPELVTIRCSLHPTASK